MKENENCDAKVCKTCGKVLSRNKREAARDWDRRYFCDMACFHARKVRSPSRYKKLKIDGKTVNKHRHLVELELGRKLTPNEIVHHKNEERFDNDLSNLQVMTHQEHQDHHTSKHQKTKACVVCSAVFTPHPTKRQRQQTCSWSCRSVLISRRAVEREARRRGGAMAQEAAALQ